jgi:hypothetical protein
MKLAIEWSSVCTDRSEPAVMLRARGRLFVRVGGSSSLPACERLRGELYDGLAA